MYNTITISLDHLLGIDTHKKLDESKDGEVRKNQSFLWNFIFLFLVKNTHIQEKECGFNTKLHYKHFFFYKYNKILTYDIRSRIIVL